jgi:hypothetical protein
MATTQMHGGVGGCPREKNCRGKGNQRQAEPDRLTRTEAGQQEGKPGQQLREVVHLPSENSS